jgi:Flp pilus assembly protein TadG
MIALRTFRKETRANAIVETALVLPFLMLLLAGAFDFGRAYYVAMEVSSAATAGAEYGIQNVTNLTGMVNAAKLDAADLTHLHATATYGCECSDGSLASVSCVSPPTSCTYTVVNYVQVTTTANFKSTITYPGVPATIPLSTTVRVRAGQ